VLSSSSYQSLDSRQPDALIEHLRRSAPEIQQVQYCEYLELLRIHDPLDHDDALNTKLIRLETYMGWVIRQLLPSRRCQRTNIHWEYVHSDI
jgi:hypothetical protein